MSSFGDETEEPFVQDIDLSQSLEELVGCAIYYRSPTLYKTDQKNGIQRWEVWIGHPEEELSENATIGYLIMIYGQELTPLGKPGKLRMARREISKGYKGKNIMQQCQLEANQRITLKKRSGYQEMGSDLSTCQLPIQLANPYRWPGKVETGGKVTTERNTNIKPEQFQKGVFVSPKIDGCRALAYRGSHGVVLLSRQYKEYQHLEHIRRATGSLLDLLPPGTVLDGELYADGIDFKTINGIVRRTANASKDEQLLKYYIFDMVDVVPTVEERFATLLDAFTQWQAWRDSKEDGASYSHIRLLSYSQVHSHDEVVELCQSFVSQGYEGIMLRVLGSHYSNGRNNNLLKMKPIDDDEGIILQVKEASGTEAGTAIMVVQDRAGNVFTCRPCGSLEDRAQILAEKELYYGLIYSYCRAPGNKLEAPRFPVGRGVRDDAAVITGDCRLVAIQQLATELVQTVFLAEIAGAHYPCLMAGERQAEFLKPNGESMTYLSLPPVGDGQYHFVLLPS